MKETKFKQTEIGEIPEDWEVKTIKEAFRMLPNNTLSRDCFNYSDGNYYNIHYGDVLIKFPEYTDCQIEEIPHINDGCANYRQSNFVPGEALHRCRTHFAFE